MEVRFIPTRFSSTSCRPEPRFPRNIVTSKSRSLPSFHRSIAVSKLSTENEAVDTSYRNRMFILGLGYVGQFFGQELKKQGWVVSGTCTSIEKKKKLEKGFDDVYLFDANVLETRTIDTLKSYTHLLVSIPPLLGTGDPMLQHERLISRLMDGNLRWICYLSSTSVYGDCGGNWVDEEYLASPTNESAKLRLAAEDGWLKLGHDLGLSAQVLRLGGIYGPGRSAINSILKQKHISESQRKRSSKKYTSRVHVADICGALTASIYSPSYGKTYNIVDDDSAPREDVFAYARDLVEQKWPGLIQHDTSFSSNAESFDKGRRSEGEKRVSNARMKKELGVNLLYPSYKSGLESIVENLQNPFLNSSSIDQ